MKRAQEKALESLVEEEIRMPLQYQVFMHNDDFTPMDFVVHVLERYFFMDRRKAIAVMQEAHQVGSAICGIFSKDYAESKIAQVMAYAALHEFPLVCSKEVA